MARQRGEQKGWLGDSRVETPPAGSLSSLLPQIEQALARVLSGSARRAIRRF
jgi:hypothetical protein